MASASSSTKVKRSGASDRGTGESLTTASAESTTTSTISNKRREVLIRQPSYCKILDDLQGTEAKVAKMKSEPGEPSVVEVTTSAAADEDAATGEGGPSSSTGSSGVQTISINGQQYQIVSPSVDNVQTITVGSSGSASQPASSSSGTVVQYAPVSQNGQTVFIPGTVGASLAVATSASGSGSIATEEAVRKREIRLLKNREAARECRNKKKEYIKCLENRVAVLENQNKALIEELKSLKELYSGQKS